MPEDIHPLDDELITAFLDEVLLEKVQRVSLAECGFSLSPGRSANLAWTRY